MEKSTKPANTKRSTYTDAKYVPAISAAPKSLPALSKKEKADRRKLYACGKGFFTLDTVKRYGKMSKQFVLCT